MTDFKTRKKDKQVFPVEKNKVAKYDRFDEKNRKTETEILEDLNLEKEKFAFHALHLTENCVILGPKEIGKHRHYLYFYNNPYSHRKAVVNKAIELGWISPVKYGKEDEGTTKLVPTKKGISLIYHYYDGLVAVKPNHGMFVSFSTQEEVERVNREIDKPSNIGINKKVERLNIIKPYYTKQDGENFDIKYHRISSGEKENRFKKQTEKEKQYEKKQKETREKNFTTTVKEISQNKKKMFLPVWFVKQNGLIPKEEVLHLDNNQTVRFKDFEVMKETEKAINIRYKKDTMNYTERWIPKSLMRTK